MNSEWSFSKSGTIYQQIVEKIQKKIVSGEFSPGDKLPSIRTLADDAGVNPNTMMRALTDLENQELLYTLRGNGKYVTDNAEIIKKVKTELAGKAFNEFMRNMHELGYDDDEIETYNNLKDGGV